jgi:hypothetical protein
MNLKEKSLFIGDTSLRYSKNDVRGEYVTILGESFYKIHNYDAIEPFFMSIVSSSDHWLFISSTGGLSAGRSSAEKALFPYYTVDKISENYENTGNKTILLIRSSKKASIWEPFSDRWMGNYSIERNLYKNKTGTTILFEENNLDLGISYRYAWRTSEHYGFVKTAWLRNLGDSPCKVELLDGIQNILPTNVSSLTQNTVSSLLDAYKRNELDPGTGLATFTLNSRLSDLAEPSESLLATTVEQLGLEQADYLLSSVQLNRFRQGKPLVKETEIRGRRGAYFTHATIELAPGFEKSWHLIADVGQDSADVANKIHWLKGSPAGKMKELDADITNGRKSLWKIIASADGLQLSANQLINDHHFANVLFNVMRGGVFADQYWIGATDFNEYISVRDHTVLQENSDFFASLPARIRLPDLLGLAEKNGSTDLIRMSHTYLPLIFSRRHGDPSRPWNRFTINIKKPDGSLKIDYEGNWRDIFQNWEALAQSYPEYVDNMVFTFLNATTVDGYNPYRISYHGIDWEIPEPGNPWANLGYWSDHQIVYLLKLMEISSQVHPKRLQNFLVRPIFSYAHVPYQIKRYADLLSDPYNTMVFNWDLEKQIESRVREIGSDGKLVHTADGKLLQASLTEKLLSLLLAKLANFVPEGGIWMNTQRPEWNDANNALVGKGLSVVTMCYLRRYIVFFRKLLSESNNKEIEINDDVNEFFSQVNEILIRFQKTLKRPMDNEKRRAMMDALGNAGSDFRWSFYIKGFSGLISYLRKEELVDFLDLGQQYIDHSLRANKRSDNLYHAYNILHLDDKSASITPLYEMLEGQVAILSSGLLSGEDSTVLLDSLRQSALYQVDQHSYILYPDEAGPGFFEKNCFTQDQADDIKLFSTLVKMNDRTLIVKDVNSIYHFSGDIHNSRDIILKLNALKTDPRYASMVANETGAILALFERKFQHEKFTGRAGAFFAYEGLGSVYWHMVTKLLLAVQEVIWNARHEPCLPGLIKVYKDIRAGLGFNKSPDIYGAFPTDPYSHTPKGQGAKQPGMSGQVKEEILARQTELGIRFDKGRLGFDTLLLDRNELLSAPSVFHYLDIKGHHQDILVNEGSLACTFCQVPIIFKVSIETCLTVYFSDGRIQSVEGSNLDSAESQHIFLRDGTVHHLTVSFMKTES